MLVRASLSHSLLTHEQNPKSPVCVQRSYLIVDALMLPLLSLLTRCKPTGFGCAEGRCGYPGETNNHNEKIFYAERCCTDYPCSRNPNCPQMYMYSKDMDLDKHPFPNINVSVPQAANRVSCTLNAMEMTVGHGCTLAIEWGKHRTDINAIWILRC